MLPTFLGRQDDLLYGYVSVELAVSDLDMVVALGLELLHDHLGTLYVPSYRSQDSGPFYRGLPYQREGSVPHQEDPVKLQGVPLTQANPVHQQTLADFYLVLLSAALYNCIQLACSLPPYSTSIGLAMSTCAGLDRFEPHTTPGILSTVDT